MKFLTPADNLNIGEVCPAWLDYALLVEWRKLNYVRPNIEEAPAEPTDTHITVMGAEHEIRNLNGDEKKKSKKMFLATTPGRIQESRSG